MATGLPILSEPPNNTIPVEQSDSEITIGLSAIPTSLDPGDHRSRASETILRNMFDGLVTRDHRNQVYLELAEEVEWIDERTLGIKLREGVLFHDGVEMTAEDVVYTFERIIQENAIEFPQPHTSPRRSLIAPLESIDQVGLYEVRLNFSDPWPPAMQLLVHQQILPKHYLEQVGTDGFRHHPIGTGPFQFVSADPDLTEVQMEKFEAYYGGAPQLAPVGPACADRIVFRAIPDPGTRVAALLVNEVDIIQDVPLDIVEGLSANPNINVQNAPGTQPILMELNTTQPFFQDVHVRRALNLAINKEKIIEDIFGSRALPLPGPISPLNAFVHEGLEPYPHDVELARSMLGESGWSASGQFFHEAEASFPVDDAMFEAGLLKDDQGRTFRFNLDTLAKWFPLAVEISRQLRSIGIAADIRVWEPEAIRPEHLLGKRDSYLDDWGDSTFDPVGYFDAKWYVYTEGGGVWSS